MPLIRSRIPFNQHKPFRTSRPAASKIIFLAFEGSVTEEEYFIRISEIYSAIKNKIQFISVAEDAVFTAPKFRSQEQIRMLSKGRPKQLVERIDQFKREKDDIYQFSQYPDDEFWIVTDVDNNWSDIEISDGKTLLDEWNEAIGLCEEKGYCYAVSNPFFEIWLLLHHDDPTDQDRSFAVTDKHAYEKTDHFRVRLSDLGVALKEKKHIVFSDYDAKKVSRAIERAAAEHMNREDLSPKYFATTVYILLQKMMDMMPENDGRDYGNIKRTVQDSMYDVG